MIRIGLTSPEALRANSAGEITTWSGQSPQSLFSCKIFGSPTLWSLWDWPELAMRRSNFGHIELALGVVHPLLRNCRVSKEQSLLSLLLDMPDLHISQLIGCETLVVLGNGVSEYPKGTLISVNQFQEATNSLELSLLELATGSEAIRRLLRMVDLDRVIERLNVQCIGAPRKDLWKTLQSLQHFRAMGAKLEWLVLDVLPVIPWAMRMEKRLADGTLLRNNLSERYWRVIHINEEIKRRLEANELPLEVWMQSGTSLQQRVNDLLCSDARASQKSKSNRLAHSMVTRLKRTLKELSSCRSSCELYPAARLPVVPNPQLPVDHCGLPRSAVTLQLFAPILMERLSELGYSTFEARELIRQADPGVWDIVEEEMSSGGVVVSLSGEVFGFNAKLTAEEAVQLPLPVLAQCAEINHSAVTYVPRTTPGQCEVREKILPRSGGRHERHRLAWEPTLELVLAAFLLTAPPRAPATGAGMCFVNADELRIAYDSGKVDLDAKIEIRVANSVCEPSKSVAAIEGKPFTRCTTTPGRVIFCEALQEAASFITEPLDRERLKQLIAERTERMGRSAGMELIARLEALATDFMTRRGDSLGIEDLLPGDWKRPILIQVDDALAKLQRLYDRGIICHTEMLNQKFEAVRDGRSKVARSSVSSPLIAHLRTTALLDQGTYEQLCGMVGHVHDFDGGLKNWPPALESISEGLSSSHYWMRVQEWRGVRTREALRGERIRGVRRWLYEGLANLKINEEDCNTAGSWEVAVGPLRSGGCRISAARVNDPITKRLILDRNEPISNSKVKQLAALNIEKVSVRSPIFCESKVGVCRKCYGEAPLECEAVAQNQSIGLRTADAIGLAVARRVRNGETNSAPLSEPSRSFEEFLSLLSGQAPKSALLAPASGVITNLSRDRNSRNLEIQVDSTEDLIVVALPAGETPCIRPGDRVTAGERLTYGGVINPDDVARILGKRGAAQHLLDEFELFFGGVCPALDDRDIELLIGQMLHYVKVVDPGDSCFARGEIVSGPVLEAENRRLANLVKITKPGDTELTVGQVIAARRLQDFKPSITARLPAADPLRSAWASACFRRLDQLAHPACGMDRLAGLAGQSSELARALLFGLDLSLSRAERSLDASGRPQSLQPKLHP